MLGNPVILFIAALIPFVIAFIWYGPLFGKTVKTLIGEHRTFWQERNMIVFFILSYLLSVLLAFGLSGLVIHQNGLLQLFVGYPDFQTPGTEIGDLYLSLMERFGDLYRTFQHGVIHGIIGSICIVLPIIGINALIGRKGGKYIWIHFGFWLVTLSLMGGVICEWF